MNNQDGFFLSISANDEHTSPESGVRKLIAKSTIKSFTVSSVRAGVISTFFRLIRSILNFDFIHFSTLPSVVLIDRTKMNKVWLFPNLTRTRILKSLASSRSLHLCLSFFHSFSNLSSRSRKLQIHVLKFCVAANFTLLQIKIWTVWFGLVSFPSYKEREYIPSRNLVKKSKDKRNIGWRIEN